MIREARFSLFNTKTSPLEGKLVETCDTKQSNLAMPRFLTSRFSFGKDSSRRSLASELNDNNEDLENFEKPHEMNGNEREIFLKVQSEMRHAKVFTNASARVLYQKVLSEIELAKERDSIGDDDHLSSPDVLRNTNILPKLRENLLTLLASAVDDGLPCVSFVSVGESVQVDAQEVPSMPINLLKTTGAISQVEHDSMLFSCNSDVNSIFNESFSLSNKSQTIEPGGLICDFNKCHNSSSLLFCDLRRGSDASSFLSSQTILENSVSNHRRSILMNGHKSGNSMNSMSGHRRSISTNGHKSGNSMNGFKSGNSMNGFKIGSSVDAPKKDSSTNVPKIGKRRRVRRLSMTMEQVGNLINNIEEKENADVEVRNKDDLFAMMQAAGAIPCFED